MWESRFVVSGVIVSLINNWDRQRRLTFSIILFILVVWLKWAKMLYITIISTALNQIKQTMDIIISKTMHTFWRVLVICSFTLKLYVGLKDLFISCFINFICLRAPPSPFPTSIRSPPRSCTRVVCLFVYLIKCVDYLSVPVWKTSVISDL